ncbi:MAG: hypothetical protein ACI8P3_002124 [Saprospiraceae bacterium]|jgi:hypothetical protein
MRLRPKVLAITANVKQITPPIVAIWFINVMMAFVVGSSPVPRVLILFQKTIALFVIVIVENNTPE